MTLTLDFQGQIFDSHILGLVRSIDLEWKRCESDTKLDAQWACSWAVGHYKELSTQRPGSPKNTTQQHDVSVQSTLDRRPMYYSQNKNGPVESECKLNNVNPHIIRNQIQIK